MKVQLIAKKIRPPGIPVSLVIKPVILEGADAAAVIAAIKQEFAVNVIPHSRLFGKQCNQMRAKVLAMTNAELEVMLAGYLKLDVPGTDAAAISELQTAGYLTVLEP
jgi:folate-dependent phosphoribosylglycinamide formyltransferase PurN